MALLKIYRHIEGPFEGEDDKWYNLCLVGEEDGELETAEIYFEDLDSALSARNTLTTTLNTLQAEVDVCSTMILN